jgi:hypothetical protein
MIREARDDGIHISRYFIPTNFFDERSNQYLEVKPGDHCQDRRKWLGNNHKNNVDPGVPDASAPQSGFTKTGNRLVVDLGRAV